MNRKGRRPEEHPNHERWLVSYADFMTLMFAFFVVMFASSQADKDRARRVSEGVERAFQEGKISTKIDELLHGRKPYIGLTSVPGQKAQKLAELKSPLEQLKKALKDDIAQGRIDVRMEGRGLVISLKQAAFFPAGDATVAMSGYESIGKVVQTLAQLPNPVRLEGHTDSIPIRNERFASNWHLSAARGIAMLDLLTSRFGMPPGQMAVVGYGDTVPVDTNDTEVGRARNRRVDITVLNDSAFGREPTAVSPDPPKEAAEKSNQTASVVRH